MAAAQLLLKAARQFEPLDPAMARQTYLEALGAALFAGRLGVGGGVREVAEAARWAPPAPQPAGGPDLLLDGLALLITEGYAAGGAGAEAGAAGLPQRAHLRCGGDALGLVRLPHRHQSLGLRDLATAVRPAG